MIHEQRPSRPHPEKLRRIALPPKLEPINPALVKHAHERAEAGENRVADAITRFAGSMLFVYLHVIWFASWIGFGVEDYPYGLLTMIVSLEAIFLSTFVMISQNRAETKQQVVAVSRKRKTMSSADKTVALTGVTGFIGSHVLTELQEHGHEVMVLVRDDSQADIVASRGATPTVVDLYDR
ncbi:MAG TPA: DUF1003 domain-containing protein, partial [Solirubrobacterales bacterium]|nr:DUF1003 domain-containing protein [Solirubrobacterales bacterium]